MRKNPTYTHLFVTIRLLIFSKKSHVYSHLYFYSFLSFHEARLYFCSCSHSPICNILILGLTSFYSFTQIQNFLVALLISIKIDKKFPPILLFSPIRLHISFSENFPPKYTFILLFSPIFLILFKEFSHLCFYSELSSIRNSRVHAWSDDHFNWNSLASIMIQEVCSSRLESFSSNNKQRIFLAPSWVFSAWHPQFLALLRNTWLLCSIFACNAARTTDAQWSLFSSKSQTLGLGQTNWADKFLGLWGIFGQFISIHFGAMSPLSMFSINQPLTKN